MPEEPNCCRVCGNTDGNNTYNVREMLLGTREEYEYFQCHSCGCLQLAEIPDDLGQFYPPGYCCHKDYRRRTRNSLRRAFDTLRVGFSLPKKGVIASLFDAVTPRLDYLAWAQFAGLDRNSRILDVGCGSGKLLIRMSMGGFRILHGIDPFIDQDIHVGGVRIDRISIQDYIDSKPESYRLVMLQHAFEHVPDPFETLRQMKELMDDDGHLLIRIPVADSYSREHYGENWFSWDAPRHTYLHTMKSMQYLAESTGFVISKVEHDATFHQLRASELYAQDVPGNEHRYALNRFSPAEVREFKSLTVKLNAEQRGEQAAFFLRKAEAAAQTHRRAA